MKKCACVWKQLRHFAHRCPTAAEHDRDIFETGPVRTVSIRGKIKKKKKKKKQNKTWNQPRKKTKTKKWKEKKAVLALQSSLQNAFSALELPAKATLFNDLSLSGRVGELFNCHWRSRGGTEKPFLKITPGFY